MVEGEMYSFFSRLVADKTCGGRDKYSFTRLLVYSFTRLLVYSSTRLLVYSLTHLLVFFSLGSVPVASLCARDALAKQWRMVARLF